MSNKSTGGPAFPYEERNGEGIPLRDHFGMTLRDYFAAKAMQALLNGSTHDSGSWHLEAKASYEIADAMLKAREA